MHWIRRVTGVASFLRPTIRLRTALVARAYPYRGNHSEAVANVPDTREPPKAPLRRLPLMCSGCGAFSQTDDARQLGYFDARSRRVRTWLHPRSDKSAIPAASAGHEQIVAEALKMLDESRLEALGLSATAMLTDVDADTVISRPPVCDRCHDLIHHSASSAKVPMHHPTVESLRETIEESPYKYNHIYHVVDAADFPLSLIPRLNVLLGDVPLRSRNRRSRAGKYVKDRQTEMSFIIARGDLLGATKEMVDAMMPYLREVLREALGRVGGRVRLGNVRCVSARRSWWTREVKEDIWRRGGAGWMVGKVNVGKSQLFEAVYPKGRMTSAAPARTPAGGGEQPRSGREEQDMDDDDLGQLLPPTQPVSNYPEMPLVSALPGTTASPIRIPYGNGRGELIDLPGLARSDLELHVREEHRAQLVMRRRIVPEQVSVTPGRSLILGGGLVRITPRTPGLVFLMYNFTPLEEHLTVTEKAVAFQEQTRRSEGVVNVCLPGAAARMAHAGTFRLRHDVTKRRAGPLTRKNAIGLQVDRLPFRVLSVDILIEGVGYVEVVAQVRARDVEGWEQQQQQQQRLRGQQGLQQEQGLRQQTRRQLETSDPFLARFDARRDGLEGLDKQAKENVEVEVDWPAVDVYTPEGRFVGSRQPIHGWLNNRPRVLPEHKKSRPRRSMKGRKKLEKLRCAGD